jgi:hypothetical protein
MKWKVVIEGESNHNVATNEESLMPTAIDIVEYLTNVLRQGGHAVTRADYEDEGTTGDAQKRDLLPPRSARCALTADLLAELLKLPDGMSIVDAKMSTSSNSGKFLLLNVTHNDPALPSETPVSLAYEKKNGAYVLTGMRESSWK